MPEIPLYRYVCYRLIEVVEVVHVVPVVRMAWHRAETVIFRNTCHIILAVVLPNTLIFHSTRILRNEPFIIG